MLCNFIRHGKFTCVKQLKSCNFTRVRVNMHTHRQKIKYVYITSWGADKVKIFTRTFWGFKLFLVFWIKVAVKYLIIQNMLSYFTVVKLNINACIMCNSFVEYFMCNFKLLQFNCINIFTAHRPLSVLKNALFPNSENYFFSSKIWKDCIRMSTFSMGVFDFKWYSIYIPSLKCSYINCGLFFFSIYKTVSMTTPIILFKQNIPDCYEPT